MSDARAIEAVTKTLWSILDAGVKEVEGGAHIVTLPPDQVSNAGHDLQVNLYLYQADVDGYLRNTDPAGIRPGETATPALPLILHYLITPYVRNGTDFDTHRMLGAAMRTLYEHPVLTRQDFADITDISDVASQVERVRIIWQPMGEKDIYSLWSAFQTQYRLSAAYEVRVVLIDARTQSRTPLPVLRRGADDRGPEAQASAATPFPSLTGAAPVTGQAAARPGEDVVISGINLTAADVEVVLSHPALGTPRSIHPPHDAAGDTSVRFTLPGDVPAGLGAVSLALTDAPAPARLTNEVPLAIAPKITNLPQDVARNGAGTTSITVACEPDIQVGQQVFLLLGARAVPAPPVTAATGSVLFTVTDAPQGTFLTRLRVGGVDSLFIKLDVTPPVFDASQTVTVT
jgi:hypothetical protein